MKRSELFFNIVSIPVDIITLIIAGLVSFYIRLHLSGIFPISFSLNFNDYLKVIFTVVPILILIFAFSGLYNLKGVRNFPAEAARVIAAISMGLLVIIFIYFFDQQVFQSRLIILTAWAAGIVCVLLGRLILGLVQRKMLEEGKGLHKLVLVNEKSGSNELADYLKKNPQAGYKVVGEVVDGPNLISDLEALYEQEDFEEIFQTNFHATPETNSDLTAFARLRGLVYNFVPNIFGLEKKTIESITFAGLPIISIKNSPLNGWGIVFKRVFDVVFGFIGFVITLPFYLVVGPMIKADSPGRIIYPSPRGGRNGYRFYIYKFRTMYSHLSVGDEFGGDEAIKMQEELWRTQNVRGGAEGMLFKVANDPRITKLGKTLRSAKIDEIPQFINVLKGDLSLVGPRPHNPDEVMRFERKYPRIFTIKPGLFGPTQLKQFSQPVMTFEEEIEVDTHYLENWSIWLDIKILAKIFWNLIFKKRPKETY